VATRCRIEDDAIPLALAHVLGEQVDDGDLVGTGQQPAIRDVADVTAVQVDAK